MVSSSTGPSSQTSNIASSRNSQVLAAENRVSHVCRFLASASPKMTEHLFIHRILGSNKPLQIVFISHI
jgi:hypothetical protein